MDTPHPRLGERLARARALIDRAARRAGRDPGEVTLVLVTKSAPPSIFAAARREGVHHVGESRVQDAERRRAGQELGFSWHLIGHLQSNKARRAVALFDVLHGVDSPGLLARVDEAAGSLGRHPDVLLQVNVSGEASKFGLAPDVLGDVLEQARTLRHARLVGLMTMAPACEDPEQARPVFRRLAELRDAHVPAAGPGGLPHLSMGMSDDFEVAVEEGATFVRLGTLLVADDAPARLRESA
ncbi:MAG: YggS family pyridoxal phosphate-dependent enzyme [Planctomycetota bacterium]|jgi:pyridoxal phosphate enzyme (YggS family)